MPIAEADPTRATGCSLGHERDVLSRAERFDLRLSALEQRMEHEARSATETEIGLMMATTIVTRAVGTADEAALTRIRAGLRTAIDSLAAERPGVARPLRYLLYNIDHARFTTPPQPTPPWRRSN